MKQFKTLLFAAILFVGATSFTMAQSKIAHINTNELIEAMPQMKTAKTELEKLSKTYEAEIQKMATEYQNKIKQYQREVDTKTEEENAKRAEEVQTIEQSIRQYQANAQEDIQKKQEELMKPIFEKAKAAIQKVAKAQGFQYVLDSTQGSGVLLADGKDLMADVKKELGF
ncbi:OmpH family outer membrane protein [Subsaxibacter sp. CAU 1640]|uniref:OmpH family outer membrane protein n=1 Tax=Subsaxibacter sp. CAU 1640 TaxID=2933271 RepID=UPI002005C337|nr:OmpH family outer membrane protein [Subsaxibacter sp. CAU 1640]MCK7590402.1 OmpH family outer membrane protein [Subsaxibacter sp. CAU 1640]